MPSRPLAPLCLPASAAASAAALLAVSSLIRPLPYSTTPGLRLIRLTLSRTAPFLANRRRRRQIIHVYLDCVVGEQINDQIIASTVWVHKSDLDRDGRVTEADFGDLGKQGWRTLATDLGKQSARLW